jgi:ABC-type transporter Mla MlaB component
MNQIKWRRKSIKLRLKGKVINFTSLHLMQLEISQVCKFPKAYVDTKNLKREDET